MCSPGEIHTLPDLYQKQEHFQTVKDQNKQTSPSLFLQLRKQDAQQEFLKNTEVFIPELNEESRYSDSRLTTRILPL